MFTGSDLSGIERGWGCMLAMAMVGIVATILGLVALAVWLFHHVRFV